MRGAGQQRERDHHGERGRERQRQGGERQQRDHAALEGPHGAEAVPVGAVGEATDEAAQRPQGDQRARERVVAQASPKAGNATSAAPRQNPTGITLRTMRQHAA